MMSLTDEHSDLYQLGCHLLQVTENITHSDVNIKDIYYLTSQKARSGTASRYMIKGPQPIFFFFSKLLVLYYVTNYLKFSGLKLKQFLWVKNLGMA